MPEPLSILLVEDCEEDVLLIQRAFASGKIRATMHVVRDGEEALWYLSGTGKYSNCAEYPLPWLVLLDLKMPRMDGFEVLKWIRNQSGIHNLVVVVLTSSGEIKDVNRAYGLGANSFMVKPLEFQNTEAIAALIDQYWLQRNQHPESARPDPKPNSQKP